MTNDKPMNKENGSQNNLSPTEVMIPIHTVRTPK
jgi:hypothetical protein